MSSNWDPLALRPPPHEEHLKVSFPQDHVMLITLNRPNNLNAITPQLTKDIATILNWFDDQTSLWYVLSPKPIGKTLTQIPVTRVVVVTGSGRAFCAGADLKA